MLPFVLAVGITGHRKDALPPETLLTLHERLRTVLGTLADAAAQVQLANRDFFSAAEPQLLFVSPLADGADQIGAHIALELGYRLHAVLPFDRDRYRNELCDDEARGPGSMPWSNARNACWSYRARPAIRSKATSWPAERRLRTATC